MRQVDKTLTLEEIAQRDQFLARLTPKDKGNVQTLIHTVDALANDYFRDTESDEELRRESEEGYRGEPDENDWAFEQQDQETGAYKTGCAFFSVYVIGGQITKQGIRPDIDLMVVTNMWWSSGYIANRDEWLLQRLHQAFDDRTKVTCPEGLPSHYKKGLWRNKAFIHLAPIDTVSTPIDIVYLRSLPKGGREEEIFITPTTFEQRDCSEDGQPLPRLLLYRALTTDISPRPLDE
ncbi:hypothetical protein HYW21_04660 [Candidatus Woesearchaeota archaeon]|nr:hypothetical protein [Candidatus Woesearchaeota archaeon]